MAKPQELPMAPSLKAQIARRKRTQRVRCINRTFPTLIALTWLIILAYVLITRH